MTFYAGVGDFLLLVFFEPSFGFRHRPPFVFREQIAPDFGTDIAFAVLEMSFWASYYGFDAFFLD